MRWAEWVILGLGVVAILIAIGNGVFDDSIQAIKQGTDTVLDLGEYTATALLGLFGLVATLVTAWNAIKWRHHRKNKKGK